MLNGDKKSEGQPEVEYYDHSGHVQVCTRSFMEQPSISQKIIKLWIYIYIRPTYT